jgi:YVTN family beta-propeller protein
MRTLKATSFFRLAPGISLLAVLASVITPVEGQQQVASQSENFLGQFEPTQIGHPSFVSPHASPIAVNNNLVFVANTPSDTVDVIDSQTRDVIARVDVGVDPVSIASRPDGKEVWVSNHISDSVSVIDTDESNPTFLHVIATVQEFDAGRKATNFDEPMGIAFASNEKAYVALSSDNQIAVIDVASREVTKRLTITAQDPREIVVRDGKLYVIPFESNNQTQLSGGAAEDIDGDLVTFDIFEHSIRNNSKLSLGHVIDVIKHPDMPDRDLYVFDTKTDELIETVDTLGTLLYGMTVDSQGRVFIAQTDARNDSNGRAGTEKHGLAEMGNRAFLNRITRVDFGGVDAQQKRFFDLEPLPPQQPDPVDALATPYGIKISEDDSTLFVSAAGSDKLITIDADSGEVLGRVAVDATPRGVALVSAEDGSPTQVWVLNAVENTVSLVDVSTTSNPRLIDTVALEDPTQPVLKRGRKAFETAMASTTGTFSCASCHPDGHTDQLVWVLATPIVTRGDQIQPRITMPIRGLRDTEPYHWDGIPGDPYGGVNAANADGHVPPNSDINDPTTSTLDLIDGGLANTMHWVGKTNTNDEGKLGMLTAAERDDMSVFLLSVPYPPAQRRPYDNVQSDRAKEGFRLFHIEGNGGGRAGVCGDCHRLPHLVSTNHPTIGMDTPTWRGAYDRFLILPQGRINLVTLKPFAELAEQGIPERELWRRTWAQREAFDPVWDMVEEHSTGYSGAFARQATLNQASLAKPITLDIVNALEQSAREEAIILAVSGVMIDGNDARAVSMRFDGQEYTCAIGSHTQEELVALTREGKFIGTFTGHHGVNTDFDHPQPALWTLSPIHEQSGPQEFPNIHSEQLSMTLSGRHVDADANIIVNGRRVDGTVKLLEKEIVSVELTERPPLGLHLLQLQTRGGLISNDFIFNVTAEAVIKRAPTLGEILNSNGWENLLGDWVDVSTRGEFQVSLNWKIKNQLLEMSFTEQAGATIASINIDPSSGEIVHSGINPLGASITGTWDFAIEEGPRFDGKFLSAEGTEGELSIQMVPKDNDALLFKIAQSNISMIRK